MTLTLKSSATTFICVIFMCYFDRLKKWGVGSVKGWGFSRNRVKSNSPKKGKIQDENILKHLVLNIL